MTHPRGVARVAKSALRLVKKSLRKKLSPSTSPLPYLPDKRQCLPDVDPTERAWYISSQSDVLGGLDA